MRSKTGLSLRRLGPLLLCPTPRGPPPLPPRFVPTWAYLVAAHWVTWFLPRTNLPGGEGIGTLVSANYQRQRLSGEPRSREETQQSPWNQTALKINPVFSGLNFSGWEGEIFREVRFSRSSLHPWEWHGSPTALPKEAEGTDCFITRASLSGEIMRRESWEIKWCRPRTKEMLLSRFDGFCVSVARKC